MSAPSMGIHSATPQMPPLQLFEQHSEGVLQGNPSGAQGGAHNPPLQLFEQHSASKPQGALSGAQGDLQNPPLQLPEQPDQQATGHRQCQT